MRGEFATARLHSSEEMVDVVGGSRPTIWVRSRKQKYRSFRL